MQFLKTNIWLLITRYTTSLFLASFLSNSCWSEWARPISNLTLVCVQALNLDKEWFLNVQLNIIHYPRCSFVNKQAVQKTIKSLLCFALATREWTCLEYQSIYLEYERQIQQKTMLEQGLICWNLLKEEWKQTQKSRTKRKFLCKHDTFPALPIWSTASKNTPDQRSHLARWFKNHKAWRYTPPQSSISD